MRTDINELIDELYKRDDLLSGIEREIYQVDDQLHAEVYGQVKRRLERDGK